MTEINKLIYNRQTSSNLSGKDERNEHSNKTVEALSPDATVKELGNDMGNIFLLWSDTFMKSKDFEHNVLKRLNGVYNEALVLETDLLNHRLEVVKRKLGEKK